MARAQPHSHTSHACHTHAWLKLKSCQKGVCCTCIIPLHLAFSISCLTHPCCSLTVTSETIPDFDVRTFLPCLLVLEAQGMRISARAQEVRQNLFCGQWHDARWRSRPPWNLWLLEKHTREHWTVRCSHNVWTLRFARFSRWFCSSNRKQRKHASGNRLLDRERKEREGSVISVVKSTSKKKSTEQC